MKIRKLYTILFLSTLIFCIFWVFYSLGAKIVQKFMKSEGQTQFIEIEIDWENLYPFSDGSTLKKQSHMSKMFSYIQDECRKFTSHNLKGYYNLVETARELRKFAQNSKLNTQNSVPVHLEAEHLRQHLQRLAVVALVAAGVFIAMPVLMGSSSTEQAEVADTSAETSTGDTQKGEGEGEGKPADESPEKTAISAVVDEHVRNAFFANEDVEASRALLDSEKAKSLVSAYMEQFYGIEGTYADTEAGATEIGLDVLAQTCLSGVRVEVEDVVSAGDDAAVAVVSFSCTAVTIPLETNQSDVKLLVEEATKEAGQTSERAFGTATLYLEKHDGSWEVCYDKGLIDAIGEKSGFFELCKHAEDCLKGSAGGDESPDDDAYVNVNGDADADADAAPNTEAIPSGAERGIGMADDP